MIILPFSKGQMIEQRIKCQYCEGKLNAPNPQALLGDAVYSRLRLRATRSERSVQSSRFSVSG
jgi:hypothetical protein